MVQDGVLKANLKNNSVTEQLFLLHDAALLSIFIS